MTVIACGGAVAALALSGCESSQSKSAELKSQAKRSAPEVGLKIERVNPDVRVTTATVLTDARSKRTAAVITLRNTSRSAHAALPLLFTLSDGAGKKLFSNGSPGASADLISVPSLPAGGTLTWVDDAIVNVAGAARVDASVGVGTLAKGAPPHLRLEKVAMHHDSIDGYTATGTIFNDSAIAQARLVIYAVARRAGKIVAAGRAVVPSLKKGPKGARFTIFLVGDANSAKLTLAAPPVNLGGTR